ncbi:AAA family ATPase [Tichowtungia aerotolerans]|uniref:AAA family ATPase n=1 Tax=Tichowtungia aerotolerans TaxID=2697043 RepID=A0A6P1M9S9_9BACT|nr:ATP-binding protein [Tichowtungia aerotolerans]QHI68326.1 AAA family ATPase [Tichowtungia aerotolerans]
MTRIVLTGAESSGKSSLTLQLGARFGLPIALEYARIWLEAHGPEYTEENLLTIFRGHLGYQQAQVPPGLSLGIFDTDLINYKIWFEEVFGHCPQEVVDAVGQETSHVYLLCAPDLPWEPDPLRENPNDRERLFERHRTEIENLNRPYEIVRGTGEERLSCAEAALNKLIRA